jgi:hypothetical protein
MTTFRIESFERGDRQIIEVIKEGQVLGRIYATEEGFRLISDHLVISEEAEEEDNITTVEIAIFP